MDRVSSSVAEAPERTRAALSEGAGWNAFSFSSGEADVDAEVDGDAVRTNVRENTDVLARLPGLQVDDCAYVIHADAAAPSLISRLQAHARTQNENRCVSCTAGTWRCCIRTPVQWSGSCRWAHPPATVHRAGPHSCRLPRPRDGS